MEDYKSVQNSEQIELNSGEICKLIESKCMKPVEVKPTDFMAKEGTSDWHFLQGYMCRTRGDFDAAINQYRLGLRKDENHEGIKLNLGVCLMKIGLIPKSLEIFTELNTVNSNINSGICYISQHNYNSAINCINKAVSVSPLPSFQQLLSLALFRAGKITEALEVFKDVDPEEALIEDERNLRYSKNPQSIFPFKVGEVGGFLKRNRARSVNVSKSFEKHSAKDWRIRSKGKKEKFVSGHKEESDEGSEFYYLPRPRPQLPSYDHFMEKKRELDRVIRRRHNTLVEAMMNNLADFKAQGFIQQRLENDSHSLFEDKYNNREMDNKIKKIRNEIENTKLDSSSHNQIDIDSIMDKKLSAQTLAIIDTQFSYDKPDRDYVLLESILIKLPFFAKFPTEIRRKLLGCAIFVKYTDEEVIIKQGALGDSMFVIVSGSIRILRQASEYGGIEIVINSMYEGETFGELSLLGESFTDNIRRSATCVAGQNTRLLKILKVDYKAILLDEMQDNIYSKVNFFNNLPFFRECSSISFIPLASNIEPEIYKIDDRIIELGEKPKGLYIIFQGRCSLYWEGYVAKPEAPSQVSNIKIRPKTPKQFYTGNIKSEPDSKHVRKESLQKSVDVKSEEFNKAKVYLPNNITGKKIFKERILFKPLREGDYFGGRALIEGRIDMGNKEAQCNVLSFGLIEVRPSKFTVIAESSEVKVFILTRRHFPLLSDEIIERLKIYMSKDYELDCPKQWSDEFLCKSFVEWNKYKQDLISKVEVENYTRKHKREIIFTKK